MKPAEDYILSQDEPFRSILIQLQMIIESVVPDCALYFKWRIPFYYSGDLPLCYLNQSKDYVDLAFWHGHQIKKFQEHFVKTNRKSVMSLRYKTLGDIDDTIVVYVIKEQLRINTNPFKMIGNSRKKL